MAQLIKRLAASILPEWGLFWVRWLCYPHLLRRMKPAQWPPFSIARRLVKRGDTVVDVGANIGFVSSLLADLVGPSGRVIAVEAVPYTFRLLRHNVRKLGLHNVTTVNAAAGALRGTGKMLVPRYATGYRNIYESRLVAPDDESQRDVVTVDIVPLDDVVSTIQLTGRLSLIKVDVEGAEVNVIEGAMQSIERHTPALIIETSGSPQQADTNLGRLCHLLCRFGYKVYCIDGSALSPIGDHDSVSGDIVFLPAAYHQSLSER